MKNLLLSALAICAINSANAQKRCSTTDKLNHAIEHDHSIVDKLSANKSLAKNWIDNEYQYRATNAVITIPVVVHVVYKDAAENISDAQIISQIDVLNEDYSRKNADTVDTPIPFRAVAANVGIQFALAAKDPNGLPTNGITRTLTTVDDIGNANYWDSNSGGADSWDDSKYLNIWVCDVGPGLLGFAWFPNSTVNGDGVVIGPNYFGNTGSVTPPFNKGRTATHEVGHFLQLEHIWGPGGASCVQDDGFADTPLQYEETYGCQTFPLTDQCTATGDGIMFSNYMDYSDDACMNIFTNEQKAQMLATLNTSRSGLVGNDDLLPTSVQSKSVNLNIELFPNPTSGKVNIRGIDSRSTITIYDQIGRMIQTDISFDSNTKSIDLNTLVSGIYFVAIASENNTITKKITISK